MYRQHQLTKKWVIFAPHRNQRPQSVASVKHEDECQVAVNCPFCAGPDAPDRQIFQVNSGKDGWSQYVLANKFPAVQSNLDPKRSKDKWGKLAIDGFGKSEVIVETREHCSPMHLRPANQVKMLFRLYKDRVIEHFKDSRVTQVIVFKNCGKNAGASQPHPHSQVYALPIVPGNIRLETDCWRRYYDDEGTCPLCDLIEEEFQADQRMILQTAKVAAICPYASENPYEVHLLPRSHVTSLTLISDQQLDAIAEAAKEILVALNETLGGFDYNLVWDSAPKDDCDAPFFHLRLRIIPRLATPAGFEIASQMSVNPVLPEIAAEQLKKALKKGSR
ncbi:MAG: galactose-1-phosphate uridylyltransferase [Candidatus Rifleibacteriota bacterium]